MRIEHPQPRSVPTALVATPDVQIRNHLSQILKRHGWRSIAAMNAHEASDALPEIAAILYDNCLRSGEWERFLISARWRYPKIPLVRIIRIGDAKAYSEAIYLGARDVLSKPLDAGEADWVVESLARSAEPAEAAPPGEAAA